MPALDTNVLVRAVVPSDDPRQTERARTRIAELCSDESPAYVNVITLCESAWVLRGPFGYDREAVFHFLERLLNQRQIRVEDGELAMRALEISRGTGMDFPDAFIGLRNASADAQPTLTFDRKAARSPLFMLI